MLAERTKESVRNMEKLVEEMHESNHLVVHAIERIRDISENEQGIEQGIEGTVSILKNLGIPTQTILVKIQEQYNLSPEDSQKYL